MTPAQRSLRSRIGAYRLHATHDSRETTAPARAAFLARFMDEVDPQRELSDTERTRRAAMARKAYFAGLAYRSAQARSKKKAATEVTPVTADAEGQANDRPAA